MSKSSFFFNYETFQVDFYGTFFTFLIVGLGIIFWIFLTSGRRRTQDDRLLLILGPSNSGKTALFLSLLRPKNRGSKTVSSSSPNAGILLPWWNVDTELATQKVSVIDFPGNPRLKSDLLLYARKAQAIIYVIDSSDKPSFKLAVEQIFYIFNDDEVAKVHRPLLFVCNKRDLPEAKNRAVVQSELEHQIDKLRVSHKSLRYGTNETEDFEATTVFFQNSNEDEFQLDRLPAEVSVCSASVLDGHTEDVRKFIENVFGEQKLGK